MKRLGVAKKRAASCEAGGDCDAASDGAVTLRRGYLRRILRQWQDDVLMCSDLWRGQRVGIVLELEHAFGYVLLSLWARETQTSEFEFIDFFVLKILSCLFLN